MLFPPYLIHSQSTSAAQETTRLGCQDLGFLDLPEVKAGYTKKMTNKGRHLAGGTGNLVSPPGNKRKQVSLPAPAQKMATTYILSQLCVTKEYLNNTSCPEITCKAYQGPHEPSWDRGISQQNSHQASTPASRHTTPTSLWNLTKNKKNCDIKCALNLNMNQPTFFIRFSGTCWVKGCRLPDAFSSESSGGISTPGRIGVTPQVNAAGDSPNSELFQRGVGCEKQKCHFWILSEWYFFELFHYDHCFLFPRRIILMQQIEDDTPEGLKGTSFVWGLKSVIAWQELLAFCLVLAKIHETVPESPPSASLIIFFTSSLVQIQQMILRYGSKKCCKVVQFPESSDPFCGHRWAIMFKNVESKHVDVDRTL